MLNVYVEKGVKEVDLFIKILETSNLKIKTFSSLNEISPKQVDVAIIWLNVPSYLKDFTNLKLILTCGSGIDHIVESSFLPKAISTIRLVDEKLRNNVADYVTKEVANYNCKINETNNSNITVGMMGMGLVGETTIHKLKKLGYNIIGWANSNSKKRTIKNYYIGLDDLPEFAKQCNVVVCQLPLTESTQNILNKNLFDLMPKEGYIINVGRGGHLNEDDLIDSIDKGHLIGACLDVLKKELNEKQNILQNHPKIRITPHIAGGIFPEEQARYAVDIINKFLKKENNIKGLVDFKMKY